MIENSFYYPKTDECVPTELIFLLFQEQIEKFKADARISSQKLQEQFEKREQQLVKELQQAKEENFRIRQQYDKQIATLEYELQQRNQQDTLSKLDNNSLSTCQSSSFDSLREIVDEQNENDNKENSKQNVSFPSKVTRRVTKKTATSKAQIDDEQPQTEERTGQKRFFSQIVLFMSRSSDSFVLSLSLTENAKSVNKKQNQNPKRSGNELKILKK